MHPSTIAFAIALVASPLAMLTPAVQSAKSPWVLAADATALQGGDSKPLVAAPLSSLGPQRSLPSTEPVASDFRSDQAGPLNGTPFSAAGSGTLSNDGSDADRSFTSTDKSGAVPNLGR